MIRVVANTAFGITITSLDLAMKYCDQYQRFRDDPRRLLDQLLRWHFRQAVLANMRIISEPIFEIDFPPGSGMMGGILSDPNVGERMEYELFSRLAGSRDLGGKRAL
ncbi:hypothetical protein DFP73DRAFT_171468 [Morchella snyderi]|nr:hypothetical protein DFP73DRAFT_171468 [Morchella snyderi]